MGTPVSLINSSPSALAEMYFRCQKIQLQACCQHDGHVANGNGHVNAPESLVDALVVRTIDEIALHQAAHLLATPNRILDPVLLVHQLQHRRHQIQPHHHLNARGQGMGTHLNAGRRRPSAQKVFGVHDQHRQAEHGVEGEVAREQYLLALSEYVTGQGEI